jgi:hypothetical protein
MARQSKDQAAKDRRIYRSLAFILLVGAISVGGIIFIDYRREDGVWKRSSAPSGEVKR